MRAYEFGMVGLGALLAARALVGCSSNAGEPGDDAGLPDVAVIADDAGSPAPLEDATVAGDAGPIDTKEGGSDAAAPPPTDAGDPGAVDASDAATSPKDAGDVDAADASDGATSLKDAGDGEVDAGGLDASDGAASALDASDGAVSPVDASDAALPSDDAASASDAGDGAPGDDAASDAGEGGADAADAAAACTSCGVSVSFLGNPAAYVSGTATSVALQGGIVPDGATASITIQTYPQGAVTAGNAHVIYATDANFTTQVDAPMTFDHEEGNNDQWYVVLPVQPAGTTVYWYALADGCDCATVLYNNPGGLASWSYTEQ